MFEFGVFGSDPSRNKRAIGVKHECYRASRKRVCVRLPRSHYHPTNCIIADELPWSLTPYISRAVTANYRKRHQTKREAFAWQTHGIDS